MGELPPRESQLADNERGDSRFKSVQMLLSCYASTLLPSQALRLHDSMGSAFARLASDAASANTNAKAAARTASAPGSHAT